MRNFGDWVGTNADWLIGTVIAALAILVTLLVFLWQRKPKTLDYEFVNDVAILSKQANSLSDKLQVLYGGRALTEPHILGVRIQNTGKVGVARDDYVDPIAVTFANRDSQIIDAFVSRGSSDGVRSKVFHSSGNVEGSEVPPMRPELLLPGEWYEAQFLFEGHPGRATVSVRFHGRTRPMRRISSSGRFFVATNYLYGITIISLLIFFLHPSKPIAFLFLIAFMGAFALSGIFLISNWRLWRLIRAKD